jgi:plastocyanin
MMKKFLLGFIALTVLTFSACKKDDGTSNNDTPGPVTITYSVDGNSVTYHAIAENAVSYAWDLGNGETPTGQDVTGTYTFPGTYNVKCTAKGRVDDTQATVDVDVTEGDPDIFNEVNVTLSGYNSETGESEAVWVWATNPGTMGDGPRESTPDTVYFNPIDQSWWQSEEGDLPEDGLDDEYSFKLNEKMEYVNNFGAAFMVNWAWAASRGYALPDIWDDLAYEAYEAPQASWSVEHIDNINDTLTFETNINGTMMPGAYVIHLTNNASLGMESAGNDYQILKLTADTLWIRYDNTFPEDLGNYYDPDELESEGAAPGDPDEAYLKLVRK